MPIKTMRKLFFVIAILFLLVGVSRAVSIENWIVDTSLNEDGTADWIVNITYSDAVPKTDYWIPIQATDINKIEVTANDTDIFCRSVSFGPGVSIQCDNVNAVNITYKFHSLNQVSQFKDFKTFSNKISLTESTKSFSMTVKLPLGSALVDKSKLQGTPLVPFEPEFGQEGSDGRRIFVKWIINNPRIGDSISASVVFESFFKIETPIGVVLIIILVSVIVVAVLFVLYFRKRQRRPEDILRVLTDSERRIMEHLVERRVMDQRDIVKKTGFSKAKVSRLIKTLRKRNLVRTIEKGRNNEIMFFEKKETKIFHRPIRLHRDQAIELIQNIITPWIEKLDEEIKQSKKKIFYPEEEYFKDIRISRSLAPLYDDLKSIYPQIDTKISEHNKMISRIDDEIKKFSNHKKIVSLVKELAQISENFMHDLERIREKLRREHKIPLSKFRK